MKDRERSVQIWEIIMWMGWMTVRWKLKTGEKRISVKR